MKAMQLTGILKMEMNDVPDPVIKNANDVLIRMKIVAVCGSDVHYYESGRIGSQVVEYPFIVGHECAGIVDKIGPDVKRVKPGDRIAIEPAISCNNCDQCKSGRPHTCRNLKFLGCPGQIEGSLSEYIVMPEECCFTIPDNLSFEEAAITEPLSIGIYAVKRSNPQKKHNIGILGYGPIGMSVMLAAKKVGCKNFFITDKIDARLKIAQQEGAENIINIDKNDPVQNFIYTEPLGLDIVYECCGKQEAMENAIDLIKPGGLIVLIGIPSFDYWKFSADNIRRKEISIINIRRQNHCVQEAIDAISSRKINIKRMVTHRFGFNDTKQAFDLVHNYHDGVMKAMIEFE
ncbi:alcohol dehydrogenase catalytic domain-containing protein [Bacteroidota bacterium]